MKLVKGAWKILVGIKDALVLIFMLLFFSALFAALSARPNRAAIHDGALVVALNGTLVEQAAEADPLAGLGGAPALEQFRLRDVLRALETAKDDSRVKAVVLDLDSFAGGYPAAVEQVAQAVGRVRASGKPVLAYATAYMDDSYLIAANASEIWAHPMGGTLFAGPGGTRLYYGELLEKLGVNAHVYRVGTYKSAVEPYIRNDMSPEARAANQALYGAILDQWRDAVKKARPQAQIDAYLSRPAELVARARGDVTRMNQATKLIDRTGDRAQFGRRVAEIAGVASGEPAGNFRAIRLADWIDANPLPTGGDKIGVITVAGEIMPGEAGPGTAGGDTVTRLLLEGLAENELKALVVRVDSPGGSALASEQIRQAVMQAKAKGLPVVVSMGSVAASGGYWIATAGDAIYAEPNTITGSIGIFGVLPTFEGTLAKIGVNADGVATTPLSGQPDLFGGTNETTDRILQTVIEDGYRKFVSLVAESRGMSPERVDQIAQGRVWIGGEARQLGLVDGFGGLDAAIAEAARRAGIAEGTKVHPVFFEQEPSPWLEFLAAFASDEDGDDWIGARAGTDLAGRIADERRGLVVQALDDARRLAAGPAVQARCLECAGLGGAPVVRGGSETLLGWLIARVTQ